ncbi:MAG: hypothetical protein AAFV98_04540 [Chloroflexota bacterium]
MLTIAYPKHTCRMLVTVLCLLMLGVSISAAQEDIETTTYEDEENGISFEYPAAWTERFEYEVGAGISIDTFAPDYTTGISVITAPSGEGLNVIERLRLSFYTFADDTEIVDYAGVMFFVYDIEIPDFNDGVGYVLLTQALSYDLLIVVLADDGMEDDYLELITSTLELPAPADIEITTFEDAGRGISFNHPIEWTSSMAGLADEDFSSGMTYATFFTPGEGQTFFDDTLGDATVLEDEYTVDYAGKTFSVVKIEDPEFFNRVGYFLLLQEPSFDFIIYIYANDGLEDTYFSIIMDSLILPEDLTREAVYIDTTTYEDEENGISFEYPLYWTEETVYQDDDASGFNLFAEDEASGIRLLVTDSGQGQTLYDDILEAMDILREAYEANYVGMTFTVVKVQVPEQDNSIGYLLFTEAPAFDLIILIFGSDGFEANYLYTIMSSLVLPEEANEDDSAD